MIPQNQPVCWVVGAGDFDAIDFSPRPGDLVIAADGGYVHLTGLGITPDILLGDFDSLDTVPDLPNIVRHPVRKDDGDTALAVKLGLERGFRAFALYGGLGGERLDHSLANIQTLAWLAQQGASGWLVGRGQVVTVIENASLRFDPACHGFLSVFCHGEHASDVTLRQLKFPLENAELDSRVPLGLSNEFIGGAAEVSVGQGTLVVVWQGRPSQAQLFI